jgi:hypothetical protein
MAEQKLSLTDAREVYEIPQDCFAIVEQVVVCHVFLYLFSNALKLTTN